MSFTLKDRMEIYAEKGKAIPFSLIKVYLLQLCRAVHYMHIKHVCHRDIKPENVLVDPLTNVVQLCDFGCSLIMNDASEEGDNETYVMSRFYRAPELILGNKMYGTAADLWSLGVVLGELFLGTILFMGSSNKDQMREIILKLGWPSKQQLKAMDPSATVFNKIDGVYGVDKKTKGESWNRIFCGVMDMDDAAIDLISKILVYAPKERLNGMEAINHSYFDDVTALMKKSDKMKKKALKTKKKMKKENVIPNNLLDWNDEEIAWAAEHNLELRRR